MLMKKDCAILPSGLRLIDKVFLVKFKNSLESTVAESNCTQKMFIN